MSTAGQFDSDGAVRFERVIPAPAADVWPFLTDSDLVAEWLGDGEIAAKVGGKVELRAGGPLIRGRVVGCDAPRAFSFTWNVYMPGSGQPVTGESVLGFELLAEGGKTRLVVTHGPIAAEYRSRTAAGWHAMLDILDARIAGKRPPDFMETFQRVHPGYEQALSSPSN